MPAAAKFLFPAQFFYFLLSGQFSRITPGYLLYAPLVRRNPVSARVVTKTLSATTQAETGFKEVSLREKEQHSATTQAETGCKEVILREKEQHSTTTRAETGFKEVILREKEQHSATTRAETGFRRTVLTWHRQPPVFRGLPSPVSDQDTAFRPGFFVRS